MQKGILLGVLMLTIAVAACTQIPGTPDKDAPKTYDMLSYEDCVAAGNPVMTSYPAQCHDPKSGKSFVSQKDILDSQKDVSCKTDSDCNLLNHDYGLGCCWAGACDRVDYSKKNWIAVNSKWLEVQRTDNCPSKEPKGNELYGECGPAPGCAAQPINENFVAKCVKNTCTKVAQNIQ